MVDEKDESYEGQEEGEYHFSDENASYDLETETPKTDTTERTAGAAMTGFSRYRRWIVGGVVGLVALLGLYRLLMPGYTPQPTDFTQTTTPTVRQIAPAKPQVTVATAPPSKTIPSTPPVAAVPAQAVPTTPAPATAIAQTAPTQAPPIQPTATTTTASQANDRMAVVEDQNTKLSNMLQIEYAQKLSEYSSQQTAMQNRIQELNAKVASMETIINQLNQLLQAKAAAAQTTQVRPRVEQRIPRMIYSVQAIIPGRAWLKSESGDTVTVAEGDILKGYGRISKIDPYDGIVQINTGTKVLTLAYGVSTES